MMLSFLWQNCPLALIKGWSLFTLYFSLNECERRWNCTFNESKCLNCPHFSVKWPFFHSTTVVWYELYFNFIIIIIIMESEWGTSCNNKWLPLFSQLTTLVQSHPPMVRFLCLLQLKCSCIPINLFTAYDIFSFLYISVYFGFSN